MQRLPDFRLPDLKLPGVRVPRVRRPNLRAPRIRGLRVHGLRRPRIDVENPSRLSGHLQFFFYLLMFVALLAIFAGAGGVGVVMLIAGAGLHVLRSSLEEVAAQRQARRERAERKGKQVRLRSHRAARRAQAAAEIRVARAPQVAAAEPAAVAAPSVAAPRLSSRRRPAVAQPGPSPARKQRVI